MTAVVRLCVQTHAVMVSDVLLSGDPISREIEQLPTVDDIAQVFSTNAEKIPVKLCQKVAIISDKFVIGWSGSYNKARNIIKGLIERQRFKPFDMGSLNVYLDALPPDSWGSGDNIVGLTGFIIQEPGLHQFVKNGTQFLSEKFGIVGLLGTGTNHFIKHLNELSDPIICSGQPNLAQKTAATALITSGAFLNTELATFQSLQNYYGAGYEITIRDGDRFRKLGDIAYLFWKARVDERGNVRGSIMPFHMFRYDYIEDYLIIRKLSFEETKSTIIVKQNRFEVRPIYDPSPEIYVAETILPPLDSAWLCNCFFVEFPDGKIGIFTHVQLQVENKNCIRLSEIGEEIEISVNQEFIKQIALQIRERFLSAA